MSCAMSHERSDEEGALQYILTTPLRSDFKKYHHYYYHHEAASQEASVAPALPIAHRHFRRVGQIDWRK